MATPKVTLAQIHALTEEQVTANLAQRGLLPPMSIWRTNVGKSDILQAYAKAGMVDPRDLPFVDIYKGATNEPLWELLFPQQRSELKGLEAAMAALQPEEKAVFIACRFLLHLGQTGWYHQEYLMDGPDYTGPEPAATIIDADGKEIAAPDQHPQVNQWNPTVTAERKLAGLELLADLELGSRSPIFPDWANESLTDDEGKAVQVLDLAKLWHRILAQKKTQSDAYRLMKAYYAWWIELRGDAEALRLYKVHYPNINDFTASGFIAGISDSLYAHLQRGLVQLPQPGQAYLEYVNRVLMNYRVHGVTGLRVSDLSEGDAVFSRVGGTILPALSKRGLPTATTMQGLVDAYLVKVPTDEVVMQRLGTLFRDM